jgi:hypothetical protein
MAASSNDASKSGELPLARTHATRETAQIFDHWVYVLSSVAMANSSDTTEVAKTPTKEQDASEQPETNDEEGANGQLPDSMSSQSILYRGIRADHE